MADVFISYSNKDSQLANQVCGALEAASIRCWIAPRDISKGTLWPEAITTALEDCPVLVLIFTANSNASPDVLNEIGLATENNAARIVFQVEDIQPSKSLKYYLHVVQWLDATVPPLKPHLRELVQAVRQALAAQTPRAVAGRVSDPTIGITQPSERAQSRLTTVSTATSKPETDSRSQIPKVSQSPGDSKTFRDWLAQYTRGWLTGLGMLALGGIVLLVVMLAQGGGAVPAVLPTQTSLLTDKPAEPTAPPTPFAATAPPTLSAATAIPTATAVLPAKSTPPDCLAVNLEWGWQSPIDGMGTMCVPEGEFTLGLPVGNKASRDGSDSPQRKVWLSAYWVDKTEVTNAMFAQFLNKTGRVDIPNEGGGPWLDIQKKMEQVGNQWRVTPGLEEHPVTYVSWYGAKAYCEWAGRRLLTEAEWEKAARGVDGRLYAWGNEPPTCTLTNYIWCLKETGTAAVDTHNNGSPYGPQDLTGNVWEWVADWFDPGAYQKLAPNVKNPTGPEMGNAKIFRGGSFKNMPNEIVTTFRDNEKPAFLDPTVGFRCGK